MSEARRGKVAKAVAKPRKKNGYKFPERFPVGEVLKDVAKKEWALGSSIGQGGFGEIYSAKEASATGNSFSFVVKIEPHENGPLFVEKHFYLKVAKNEDVESWKKEEGITVLGIPSFHGFGSHEFRNEKYRFLVMERYGKDIWSIFLENDREFPLEVIYKWAIQIIDVLKYIHSKGYVHGDIKGANLLLGLRKGTEQNVFLVDFGLACKYQVGKEFKRDPKKAHNGTIEYTSRDWHMGVPTRRGDMEILGFNLLQWAASELPWEKDLKTPEKVHQKKEEVMKNIKSYFKANSTIVPSAIIEYLQYVSSLEHDQEPDYEFCKKLFKKELGKMGSAASRKQIFSPNRAQGSAGVRRKKEATPRKNKKLKTDSEEDLEPLKLTPVAVNGSIDPATDEVKNPKSARSRQPGVTKDKPSWRDAPTAKASNITKAGEYTRTTSLVKNKRKNTKTNA